MSVNTMKDYAREGYYVVPLHGIKEDGTCTCGKRHKGEGKTPYIKWREGRSRDDRTVTGWVNQWPGANVGLPTGPLNGFWALDLDLYKTDSVAALQKLLGGQALPNTPSAKTGGGGRHLLFKWDARAEELGISTQAGLFGCLDLRGDGAYIVAPGSKHTSGKPYEWETGKSLGEIPLATCPDFLYDALEQELTKSKVTTASRANVDWVGEKVVSGRHNYLLTSAVKLAFSFAIDERALADMLEHIQNQVCQYGEKEEPYSRQDLEKIARDARSYAKAEKQGNSSAYDLSDIGYVEQYFRIFGDHLRYSEQDGWKSWEGKYWRSTKAGRSIVQANLSRLRDHLTQMTSGGSKEETRWASALGNAGKVGSLYTMIQNDTKVFVDDPAKYFDQQPHLLNLRNGVFDLSRGAFLDMEDTRSLALSQFVDVEYTGSRPFAEVRKWYSVLLDVFGRGKRDYRTEVKPMIEFFQAAIGYSMTGYTNEQVFFIAKGQGGTGKGTVFRAIANCLGTYWSSVEPKVFLENNGYSGHNDSLASVASARFLETTEFPSSTKINESIVKQLTGQDTIQVSKKGKSSFSFRAPFKIWVQTNVLPRMYDNGQDALTRRMVVIPFTVKQKNINLNIDDELGEIKETVLAWMIDGVRKWKERASSGLTFRDNQPSVIRAQTEVIQESTDKLGEFLTEWVRRDEHAGIRSSELYHLWRMYAEENGLQAGSKAGFLSQVRERPDSSGLGYGRCGREYDQTTYVQGLGIADNQIWERWYKERAGEYEPRFEFGSGKDALRELVFPAMLNEQLPKIG